MSTSAQLKRAEPEIDGLNVLGLEARALESLGAGAEVRVTIERPNDAATVMALVERAFGPGRYAKVSERLREGNRMIPALSFCAFGAGELVGCVRQWPIEVGGARGLFLGPIAVEAAWRKHGVGCKLVDHCIAAGEAADEAFILLVGDPPFFGPHGFEPAHPAGRILLPGPVDGRRILWRALKPGGTDGVEGAVAIPRADLV